MKIEIMTRDEVIRMAREADIDWHKHWNDDESNRLERFAALVAAENEALRADAQRYRKLTADADFAASIMADAYSTWDTDDDWGPWLTAYIDEGKWLTANINKGKP